MSATPIPIPIVVSAYNRADSLARILGSLARAHYPSVSIPLIISLDAGGPGGALEVAHAFDWPYGPKHVVPHPTQLGMRDHAFACVDRLEDYEQLIFLEDDSYVGQTFYQFALGVAAHLSADESLFAASLYAFDYCEFDGLSFAPLKTGEDMFLMKSASTWGVVFSRQQWRAFRDWHAHHKDGTRGAQFIPDAVNNWPKTSWKKFINRFLSDTNRYYVYPYASQLTHFGDRGTHFSADSGNFQVPTLHTGDQTMRPLRFALDRAVRYDEFWEMEPPESLKSALGCDFEMDLRRIKQPSQYRQPFVVTSRQPERFRRGFDNSLWPLEANVLAGSPGDLLRLFERSETDAQLVSPSRATPAEVRKYMKDIGARQELRLVWDRLKKRSIFWR